MWMIGCNIIKNFIGWWCELQSGQPFYPWFEVWTGSVILYMKYIIKVKDNLQGSFNIFSGLCFIYLSLLYNFFPRMTPSKKASSLEGCTLNTIFCSQFWFIRELGGIFDLWSFDEVSYSNKFVNFLVICWEFQFLYVWWTHKVFL